ncbi:hypothetical protein Tco_0431669 [Tanacetum coccineum]
MTNTIVLLLFEMHCDVNHDPGVKSSQDSPQIDHNCCYECGDSSDGIFCRQCICNLCIFLYSVIHHPSQETSKEILQARDYLMEAIQAFLKEYDHIPPNKKCMALLLAEERFFKIKQAMEEEQNQPEVLQELILKLMNDLQILKGIKQEKEKQAAQGFISYWNFSMIDDEEAIDNFLKDVCTFLRKFSRIPFGVTPKVILIAWESFGKIKDALTDDQYQQEDIQELMSELLEDVRNISEELSEYINYSSWNRPTIFFNDDDEYTIIYSKPKAITPDLPIEEPDNSLSMGDEHLSTILETKLDEIIKSSVEILIPIPSEFEGISDDICDVPVCKDSSTFDALSDHFEILSDSNDDGTLSDDDDFEDIEYVSLEEVNNDQKEKEFDLIEPDQGELTNVVIEEVDTFLVPEDSIPPGIESNFDPGEGGIDFSQNVEDDDSFTFVIRTFLPFLTYPVDSPLLLSTWSEDTIFDPSIST